MSTTATEERKVESPDEIVLLRRRDTHLKEIEVKEYDVDKFFRDWKHQADEALAAKKKYDSTVTELREMIAEGRDPQKRLPGMSALSTPSGNAKQDESWKKVSVIEGVGATGKMAELLKENGIENMGQFADADGRDEIRKIKGIGEGKYEKLKTNLIAFLERTRDKNLSHSNETVKPSENGSLPTSVLYKNKDGEWVGPHAVERYMGQRAVIRVGNATKTLRPNQYKTAE